MEELKSLVVQTLETNGVLGQIRAQLRANVYKAIDSDEDPVAAAPPPARPAKLTKSPVGKLMAEIVAEFFEFYQFRHSLSVFLPEANLGKDRRSRAEVAFDAGLVRVRTDASILEQLVGLASGSESQKGGEGWHSSASSTTASSPPPQVAASMASTRQQTWETATGGGDTPPAGQLRGIGDRTRLGGGAAIADAISSVVSGGSRGSTGADDKKDEVQKSTDDDVQDEVTQRRKPHAKLPSLGPTSPLGAGKDLLPPLRSSGLGGGVSHSIVANSNLGAEEVSLGDQSGAGAGSDKLEEMDRQFDRQIARLNRTAAGEGSAPENTVPPKEETVGLLGSRKPAASPEGSPANSPDRSVSSVGSSRSASRSVVSPSDAPEVADRSMGTASEPGTPAGGKVPADREDSISMEDSVGSGDLDLTGGRGALAADSSGGGSSLAAGPKRAPASLSNSGGKDDDDQNVEEVEEESIEEHVSEGSFSVEGYQSEANHSSSNDKF